MDSFSTDSSFNTYTSVSDTASLSDASSSQLFSQRSSGGSGNKQPNVKCRYFLNNGYCFYGDACQFVHVRPGNNTGVRPKQDSYASSEGLILFISQSIIVVKKVFNILLTMYVISSFEFFSILDDSAFLPSAAPFVPKQPQQQQQPHHHQQQQQQQHQQQQHQQQQQQQPQQPPPQQPKFNEPPKRGFKKTAQNSDKNNSDFLSQQFRRMRLIQQVNVKPKYFVFTLYKCCILFSIFKNIELLLQLLK